MLTVLRGETFKVWLDFKGPHPHRWDSAVLKGGLVPFASLLSVLHYGRI